MNDIELDEMLNQWGVPPVGAELRERVRAGFVAAPKRRYFPSVGWKGLFAGFATAAIVFMVITAEAFPDVLSSPSPALRRTYLAMSNVTAYAKDGSSRLESMIYSYSYKGTEIVVMEEEPDDPIHQAIINIHASMHLLLLRFAPNVVMPESSARDAWFSSYVKSGCVDKGDVVIGHEKVLGYETTVIQNSWRRLESPVSGGGYRVTKQRDTVRVLGRRADGSVAERSVPACSDLHVRCADQDSRQRSSLWHRRRWFLPGLSTKRPACLPHGALRRL